MNYFVARGGQQYGPYSAETVQKYLSEGSLLPSDHAREESMQTWSTLAQLFPQFAPPPVVLAPPPAPPQAAPQVPPVAPAYQPPAQTYQTPAYQPPVQYGAVPAQQPVPPSLHWALVLLISVFTLVFGVIWAFVQANFVKKIDHRNNATVLYILYAVLFVIGMGLYFGGIIAMGNSDDPSTGAGMMAISSLFNLGGAACVIVGAFKIRNSMVAYYNSVENIGLRMSGMMTFFFTILYIQYHMTRIANWKKTGVIAPQNP
jgi:hypothetical protein